MNISIIGGKILVEDVNRFIKGLKEIIDLPFILQVVDAGYMVSIDQINLAIGKTIESFKKGDNISKDPSIEFLLYLSGKRNINKAIAMGIKQGENYAVFIISDEDVDKLKRIERDIKERFVIEPIDINDLIRYNNAKKKKLMDFYGVTEEEVAAVGEKKLPKLILEREVLLDLLK